MNFLDYHCIPITSLSNLDKEMQIKSRIDRYAMDGFLFLSPPDIIMARVHLNSSEPRSLVLLAPPYSPPLLVYLVVMLRFRAQNIYNVNTEEIYGTRKTCNLSTHCIYFQWGTTSQSLGNKRTTWVDPVENCMRSLRARGDVI